MMLSTIYSLALHGGKTLKHPQGLDAVVSMLGNPMIAMVIALIFAVWSMGIHRGRTMVQVGKTMEEAIKSIAMLLMVIGGGAAFKQVLINGGVGDAVQSLMAHANLSPLFLAWLITVSTYFIGFSNGFRNDGCRISGSIDAFYWGKPSANGACNRVWIISGLTCQ